MKMTDHSSLSGSETDFSSVRTPPLDGIRHLLLIYRCTDELLTVYVVLRIVSGSEDVLKEFLPRLDIKLDVHAVNVLQAQPDKIEVRGQEEAEKDLIFSANVKHDTDPFIALDATQDSEGHDMPTVFAIWEIEATLFRPRIRFPRPALTFTASASLRPPRRMSRAGLKMTIYQVWNRGPPTFWND